MAQPRSGIDAEQPSEADVRQGGSVFLRWLPFFLAWMAVIAGLMWSAPVVPLPSFITAPSWLLCAFLMPLAAFLVPACWRIPRNERKLTWLALPTFLAGAALALVAGGVGAGLAWNERGRSTQAEVVAVDEGKTNRCTLRKADGEEISPDLREGEGCDGGVRPGDVLSVRYDPEGGLEPTAESGKPGEPRWDVMAGLAVVFVVFGASGAVRMDRRRREHDRA
ncbi:hypothetical protein OG530_21475 [Streptomyces decoyicus]|uniref:hypothetical protein n=1 Tax=Streptomyces decoyicus TaxID=249567 RepID=UPI002E1745D6